MQVLATLRLNAARRAATAISAASVSPDQSRPASYPGKIALEIIYRR